ncbi:MAG: hypothetical protein H0W30_05755 [Gemmatimonadaceae bacterium]|nr:hypothetical protein [Gemmatimonadaceae bacterium]
MARENNAVECRCVARRPIITAFREDVPSLAEVAGMFRGTFSLGRGSEAQEVDASLVSGNFFRLLGVQPARINS